MGFLKVFLFFTLAWKDYICFIYHFTHFIYYVMEFLYSVKYDSWNCCFYFQHSSRLYFVVKIYSHFHIFVKLFVYYYIYFIKFYVEELSLMVVTTEKLLLSFNIWYLFSYFYVFYFVVKYILNFIIYFDCIFVREDILIIIFFVDYICISFIYLYVKIFCLMLVYVYVFYMWLWMYVYKKFLRIFFILKPKKL